MKSTEFLERYADRIERLENLDAYVQTLQEQLDVLASGIKDFQESFSELTWELGPVKEDLVEANRNELDLLVKSKEARAGRMEVKWLLQLMHENGLPPAMAERYIDYRGLLPDGIRTERPKGVQHSAISSWNREWSDWLKSLPLKEQNDLELKVHTDELEQLLENEELSPKVLDNLCDWIIHGNSPNESTARYESIMPDQEQIYQEMRIAMYRMNPAQRRLYMAGFIPDERNAVRGFEGIKKTILFLVMKLDQLRMENANLSAELEKHRVDASDDLDEELPFL